MNPLFIYSGLVILGIILIRAMVKGSVKWYLKQKQLENPEFRHKKDWIKNHPSFYEQPTYYKQYNK